ncbi:MAG: hypothetical protein ACRCUJ_07265, partial [Phocaeicola sp.]
FRTRLIYIVQGKKQSDLTLNLLLKAQHTEEKLESSWNKMLCGIYFTNSIEHHAAEDTRKTEIKTICDIHFTSSIEQNLFFSPT